MYATETTTNKMAKSKATNLCTGKKCVDDAIKQKLYAHAK